MKKRFKKWLKYITVSYVPGTSQLATMEAKRLSAFICYYYDEHQQNIILDEIKANVIVYREQQIVNQQELIIKENKRLTMLSNNLLKLNH